MLNAEILSLGNELIEGLRTNTNAAWLAKQLTRLGIRVNRITCVGDALREITAAMRESLSRRPDVLIITGGLGATPDDRTREALALALRRKLILSSMALKLIESSHRCSGQPRSIEHKGLVKAKKRMASIPKGSTPLPNPVGLAPGIKLRHGGTLIICLPGVPAEAKAIFRTSVRPDLTKLGGQLMCSRTVLVEGIDETTLAPLLERLAHAFPSVDVRSYPSWKGAKSRIKIMLVASTADEVKAAVEFLEGSLKELHRALAS
ncbi:MAG: molybdopterin-binding protein [Hadesarchaea archaeon]|nr:molybdopterin-binding protein [Hadesarchaea archaeon]